MSEKPPEPPEPPPEPPREPPSEPPPEPPPAHPEGDGAKLPRGGSLPLAIGLGLVFLYLAGLSMLPAIGPRGPYGAPLGLTIAYWTVFIGYPVLAIMLAVRRRSSLTGAGMLVAFGIWLLLGGEVCVGVLFQMRQA